MSSEVLEKCSASVTIPMAQGTESLNAAVAAAILLWEISRKKNIGKAFYRVSVSTNKI
ncbi:MAG: TrmH family RNA methyltransferase [Eubacteriales bacterium]